MLESTPRDLRGTTPSPGDSPVFRGNNPVFQREKPGFQREKPPIPYCGRMTMLYFGDAKHGSPQRENRC